MTTLRAGGATDVGRVRSVNEDAYLVVDGLYAVADGVGGHQAGEVASATAVEALQEDFTSATGGGLVAAVEAANEAVWTLAQESTERRGMGTTLCVLALVADDHGEDQLALANVGDSRGYVFQGGELVQVTQDHSLVEEMVREGQLTHEEAKVHPRRSIITRALGMEPAIEVDLWTLSLATGDRVLLCSDGLTNEVADDRIAATLRRLRDPGECARELVRQARASGGNDNITVVVVEVADDGGRGASAAAAVRADAGPTAGRPVPGTSPIGAGEPADGSTDSGHPASGAPGIGPDDAAPLGEGTGVVPGFGPRPSWGPLGAGRGEPRARRLTWRVLAFAVVVLTVLGLGGAAVAWYARGSYYVGLDGNDVAIYKGRPGGLLWFQPTLETTTDLTTGDVAPARVDELRSGKGRASLAEARAYVDRLRDEARRLGVTPTTVGDGATTPLFPPRSEGSDPSTVTTAGAPGPFATSTSAAPGPGAPRSVTP